MLKALKNYKSYERLSSIIFFPSLLCLLLIFVLKEMFEWSFLDYLYIIISAIFLISIIINITPNFLENNIKHIVVDLLLISIIIVLLFFG